MWRSRASATTATRLRLILYRRARPSMMEGALDRAPTTTPSRAAAPTPAAPSSSASASAVSGASVRAGAAAAFAARRPASREALAGQDGGENPILAAFWARALGPVEAAAAALRARRARLGALRF